MKYCLKNCFSPEDGFTLFELLIALALTALIGSVLFQTWNMTAQSGADAAKLVSRREKERIVYALMDNDFTGMIFPREETSNLPFPSTEPIDQSEEFYKIMGRDKKKRERNKRKTLISFAGVTSLASSETAPGWPVCIEYVLDGNGSNNTLLRRERQACGISGDFPWRENTLLENIRDAEAELIFDNGVRRTKWTDEDLKAQPVALRLIWTKSNGVEEEMLFPVFQGRIEVEWEE